MKSVVGKKIIVEYPLNKPGFDLSQSESARFRHHLFVHNHQDQQR
jgi:hypothetical protein